MQISKLSFRVDLRMVYFLLFSLAAQACEKNGDDAKRKAKRKSVQVTKKVRYSSKENLFFDFYSPKVRRSEKMPLVIFIHGGGW